MIFAMYRFGLNLGTTVAPLLGFGLYYLGGNTFTLLFWVDALASLGYAALAAFALPGPDRSALDSLRNLWDSLRGLVPVDRLRRRTGGGPGGRPAAGAPAAGTAAGSSVAGRTTTGQTPAAAGAAGSGGYAGMLRDNRYVLYLVATFLSVAVYVQYQTILPLDVTGQGLKIFWYTLAVSLNGFIVIAFELLVTKVSQRWPMRVSISLALVLVACGVAFYGLPLGPAVIIIGTLIWTLGELLGGPATFAYAAVAGPAALKSRYIGGYQFMFGLGTAIGPVVGGALFTIYHHSAWPIFAVVELVALGFALAGIRSRKAATRPVLADEALLAAGLPSVPLPVRRQPVRAVPPPHGGARDWMRAPAPRDRARIWVRPPDRARDWVRPAAAVPGTAAPQAPVPTGPPAPRAATPLKTRSAKVAAPADDTAGFVPAEVAIETNGSAVPARAD
jgi:hypothetical protein